MEPSMRHHQEIAAASRTSPPEDMVPKPQLPPPSEQALKCPRCDSINTKFCYYNNYSLSQPRYFCKSCRRYWTRGGTLRNVPVGGGYRRTKKPSSKRASHDQYTQFSVVPDTPSPALTSLTGLAFDSVDLSLRFGGPHKLPDVEFPVLETIGFQNNLGGCQGFLDSLRTGTFFESPNIAGSFGQSLLHNNGGGGGGGVGSYVESSSAAAMGLIEAKAEPFSGNLEGEGRVLWGFPWQVNSDHDVESGSDKGGWTGLNPSTWHGLLNNPLL